MAATSAYGRIRRVYHMSGRLFDEGCAGPLDVLVLGPPMGLKEVAGALAGMRRRHAASVQYVESVEWARDVAADPLAPLGDRWLHVQAVAARAADVALVLPREMRGLLVAAAWLHDLGYAPQLVDSGFHPIDGGQYLLGQEPADLAGLVAHHSCSHIEAEERGLSGRLAPFLEGPPPVARALTYCDMTTGPAGEAFTLEQRLEEIESRYGSGHVVVSSVRRARPCLEDAVEETERLIALLSPRR